MGCYDTPNANTPNLDQLAKEGVVFDRHYDTTAICMASRASVFTGLFEFKHGCNFDHGPMVKDIWQKSYPVLLRQAGYRTGFAGKFGLEVVDNPKDKKKRLPTKDFDSWGGGPGQTSYETKRNRSMARYAKEYPHSTRSYGAFGRDFILEASEDDRPFCLSISFKAPHHPVEPDPLDDHVFKRMTFSKPGNYGREFGEHFSLQSRQGRQYERFHSWNYSDKYDETIARYFQQIYAIDVAVGMIRKALEDSGTKDDTVVIYTSDNGFMNGSHGYGSKVLPYEESTRVPLIMLDPRSPVSGLGRRSKALTGNVDFAPTILKLAGLPIPPDTDGQDLMPLYNDPESAGHESLPLINVWGPKEVFSMAVVTTDWKFVYWPWAAKGYEATEELYDLADDRLELQNVIEKEAAATHLQTMRSLYDDAIKQWKTESVKWNNYQRFGTLFDRNLSWDEKTK